MIHMKRVNLSACAHDASGVLSIDHGIDARATDTDRRGKLFVPKTIVIVGRKSDWGFQLQQDATIGLPGYLVR